MTPDGMAAFGELDAYFRQLIRKRRSEAPQDNVLGTLLAIELDGEKLDDAAVASHLSMLIIGGAETFPKTFANALRRLAEHPDQRAECVAESGARPGRLQRGAALRHADPVPVPRGHAGDRVPRPDPAARASRCSSCIPPATTTSGSSRTPTSSTSTASRRASCRFGYGPHSCIGINVARLEAKVCLEETLKAIPEYAARSRDHAERLVTDFVQGYAKFPITF